jgi:hypothetical protein
LKSSWSLGTISVLLLNSCCLRPAPSPECQADGVSSDGTACDGGICIGGTCHAGCLIDGGLYDAGDLVDSDFCQFCFPGTSRTRSTTGPEGAFCPFSEKAGSAGTCYSWPSADGGTHLACLCSSQNSICSNEPDAGVCCAGFCRDAGLGYDTCCTTMPFGCIADWECCNGPCCGTDAGALGYCSPDGGC